jgi:2-oxo-4-hydroxy-4-carboxy-5-ureidoimidazoline decarboxylase
VDDNDSLPLPHKPADLALPGFLKIYGALYEKSPWIVEAVFAQKDQSIDTVGEFLSALRKVVDEGGRDKQLDLIRAHPDLAPAPAVAAKMTSHSVSEQKGAGLNQCTPAEAAEFQNLNAEYRQKFGFPFIIAVKGLTKFDILDAFRARLNNPQDEEFATALGQIHKIARLRLLAVLGK